ncbi:MAG: hypothetical protein LR015_00020 [Verrucomicrobia bacterium]|nr:hypothetical protein [Verrucomicrobiota bacterium]
MKQSTLQLCALMAASSLGIAHLQAESVVIYAEDFSSVDLGRVFTNQDAWWGPNWNPGDLVQTQASATGPDGRVAVTRSTQVFAGRFYGGGLRGPTVPFTFPADWSGNASDVTMSFWVRGTSSQSRGPLGVAVFSKDAANNNTGAAYYLLPIVPAQWSEVTVNFADMRAGVPNIAPADTAFNFSSPALQVFFFMRTDYEDGWPFQEDEGHTYSVSVADIQIAVASTGEGGGDNSWAGFPIVDGWVDTGDWLGWLYVEYAPWIYSQILNNFLYIPEEPSAHGVWAYALKR